MAISEPIGVAITVAICISIAMSIAISVSMALGVTIGFQVQRISNNKLGDPRDEAIGIVRDMICHIVGLMVDYSARTAMGTARRLVLRFGYVQEKSRRVSQSIAYSRAG
jgi:hypothetical protein